MSTNPRKKLFKEANDGWLSKRDANEILNSATRTAYENLDDADKNVVFQAATLLADKFKNMGFTGALELLSIVGQHVRD